MTGNQYRDLIASYIHETYGPFGLVAYVEIALGKTVIGKDRYIDVFVIRPDDRKAIAIECKYQDSMGTVDEKIPYALQDLEALWVPGCLVYAGKGWSRGVLHTLEGKPLAVVSAGVGEMRGWAAAQNKLAQLSTNSTHRTVAGATHETLLEDKAFAGFASAAITHVVETARSADR